MAKDSSESNSILHMLVLVVLVVLVLYAGYYLYTKYMGKSVSQDSSSSELENESHHRRMMRENYSQEGEMEGISYKDKGRPNGQENPIMNKTEYLAKGPVVGASDVEHFSNNPDYEVQRNLTSFPKDQLTAQELLPQDNSSTWAQVNPSGEGSLKDKNFLQSGYHIGINTVGQTMRNSNWGLRSEPPCPQTVVSPWMQTTITPDVGRKPLEIGGCA